MKQQIVPANAGDNYDWSNDHIYVKSASALSDGRVTLVEDMLKPGFHLARHLHKRMVEVFYILEGEVVFAFDDETIAATPGTTITIPTNVVHEVSCAAGGKMLTIFSPGGFEHYLAELASMSADQFADTALMNALGERYDSWFV